MKFLFTARRALFVSSLLLSSPVLLAQQASCCLETTATVRVPTGPAFNSFDMKVSPKKCVAISEATSGKVFLYSLDEQTCALDSQLKDTILVPGARGLAFSPDGSCLAVSDYNRRVYIFRLNACGCTVNKKKSPQIFTFDASAYPVAPRPFFATFSPDGNCLAVGLSARSEVALFKVSKKCCNFAGDPTLISTQGTANCSAGGDCVTGLAYSSNGSCLAVANFASNSITLFKVDKCGCNLITPGTVYPAVGAALPSFSSNGKCLAVTSNTTGILNIFSIKDCQATALPLQNNVLGRYGVAYSTNGKCLLTTRLFDAVASYRVNKTSCSAIVQEAEPFIGATSVAVNCSCVVANGFALNPVQLALRSYKLGCCPDALQGIPHLALSHDLRSAEELKLLNETDVLQGCHYNPEEKSEKKAEENAAETKNSERNDSTGFLTSLFHGLKNLFS